jgi:hypothetical protein
MDICDQKFINDNVTVIIRTIGERTEKLCYELLQKQVSEENIYRVSEVPFTAALEKTFSVAIKADRKWTFVVDADVLIRPGVLGVLIEQAEALEENIFGIVGQVIDKFFGSPRKAGNHLYRTKLMHSALQYIPNPLDAIRPESFVKIKMRENGYDGKELETIVGLHDFEQSYRDIYRKSFVQAKKHKSTVHSLIPLWQHLATEDMDYIIALRGFEDGNNYTDFVGIDQNSIFLTTFDDVLLDLQLSEKKQIKDLTEIGLLWEVACHVVPVFQKYAIEQQMKDLRNSNSYRLGWALLSPVRCIKSIMQK